MASASTNFIDAVLKGIGAPINAKNVTAMQEWVAAEGGGSNNPLNTKEQEEGSGTDPANGISTYGSEAEGVQATIDTIKQSNMTGIRAAFIHGANAEDIKQAIIASPWSGDHYKDTYYGGTALAGPAGPGEPASMPNPTNTATPANATLAADVTPAKPAAAAAPAAPASPPVGGTLDAPGSATTQQLAGLPQAQYPGTVEDNYTGPGAYKGFDMQAIPGDMRTQVEQSIDNYLKDPTLKSQIFGDIQYNYGAESWAMSDPQLRTLLVAGTLLDWGKDPNLFTNMLEKTKWYSTQSDSQRSWDQISANNPGQAKVATGQATARVTDLANELGVQLTNAQKNALGSEAVKNSINQNGTYDESVLSTEQLSQMITGEFSASGFLAQQSGAGATPTILQNGQYVPNGAAGVATGTTGNTAGEPGGLAATLYNQFSAIAKNYYLPLTPSQITKQVQTYLQGYTGQGDFASSAAQGFESYAKQQAATLFPALGNILGTSNESGSTAQTPYSALGGYRTLIANLTGYQGDPDTINLSSPQYSWILTGNGPPGSATAQNGQSGKDSNATSTLPTYDTVQTYLMQQPAYQTTDAGKSQGWAVGSAILKAFGYGG